MGDMAGLLKRLQASGIAFGDEIKDAMLSLDVSDFTDYCSEAFYHDRPIPFMESSTGGVKTISAPHMIVSLLHHLELAEGQEVLILGSKGGYLAALVALIVGEEGTVRVLDPNNEVVNYTRSNLSHWPTVEVRSLESVCIAPVAIPGDLNRVLVTGQITELPMWIKERIVDGGFALAPIGNSTGQELQKIEKQDEMLIPTDLGPVAFGPVDIKDSEEKPISPDELADLIELACETAGELGLFEGNEEEELQDLVAELRMLPDDLPPCGEGGIPVEEHPMVQLMWRSSPAFLSIWPFLQLMMHPTLASPGAQDWDFSSDEFDEFTA